MSRRYGAWPGPHVEGGQRVAVDERAVVIEERAQVGGLAAFAHGDAEVGAFDGQNVVDAVADHGDMGTLVL